MVEYEHLKRLLDALLVKDRNMKQGKDYYIRSLYFDTPENKDYYDKLIGVAHRKKIRLRIYDTSADKVKLEMKNKDNDYSIKETMTISRKEAMKILKGDYHVLAEYDNEISQKAYFTRRAHAYTPKVVVDYEREAYLLPVENIRITFDKRVRAYKGDGLFEEHNAFVGVLAPEYMILEVKYDRYLPAYVENVLSSINMQRMSISKYCMAREIVG
jgi:SPX domain-containing protein involved in vacuolar polyphosphate accumulation